MKYVTFSEGFSVPSKVFTAAFVLDKFTSTLLASQAKGASPKSEKLECRLLAAFCSSPS
jgi:hypothetical protein